MLCADFTSDYFPPEAVIMLTHSNPTVKRADPSRGEKRFVCKVSTFVLFPTFDITVQFENGSSSEGNIFREEPLKRRFTMEQAFSLNMTEKITKITCRGPARNATKWLSASITVAGTDVVNTKEAIILSPYVIRTAFVGFMLVAILFFVLGLRMYRTSRVSYILHSVCNSVPVTLDSLCKLLVLYVEGESPCVFFIGASPSHCHEQRTRHRNS